MTPAADSAAVQLDPGTEVELFCLAGHDGHLRTVNEAFAHLLGLTTEQVDGRSLLELVHPDDLPAIVAGLAALEGGAPEVLLENRFIQRDGQTLHLQWVARPRAGTDLWWAAGRDTTAFHRLLAERRDLQARLELAVGTSTAAMWELDLKHDRFTWEPQAAELLGVAVDTMPTDGAALVASLHPEDGDEVHRALRQLQEVGTMEVAARVRGDGSRHVSLRGKILDRDRRGRPARAVGLVIDISAEKAMEEQMLRMVMSDGLTGVPNRRAFDQALRKEWRRCRRAHEPVSVLMIDIDDFKRFNDTFGHLAGDDVLTTVARALTANLGREGDVLARFGGEEFAAVLPDTGAPGALALGERMVEAVRAITMRQSARWRLSVSVGVATADPDQPGGNAVDLVGSADRALYAAKAAGKDRAVAHGDLPRSDDPGDPAPVVDPQPALGGSR